jgi:prepilin-type N-terminal cleavage/methylation domain-containing protein
MHGRLRSSGGFSLLELLIVVGIILVIATMAIPSLLRSRQTANEHAAVATLRSISNAEASYVANGGSYGSASALISQQLLDDRFNGAVGGYNYSITAGAYAYSVIATPTSPNTGRYGYYMTTDGVIRYSTLITMAPNGRAGNAVN